MESRIEIVSSHYNSCDEDGRLDRSRHGQMEYFTTMHYIHRFLTPGAKVLELGAGTGRYSVALAKEGMDVTAVELVESNLAVLRENGLSIPGDAQVASFSDADLLKNAQPPVSALHFDSAELGRAACREFIRALNEEEYDPKPLLGYKIRLRQSML